MSSIFGIERVYDVNVISSFIIISNSFSGNTAFLSKVSTKRKYIEFYEDHFRRENSQTVKGKL